MTAQIVQLGKRRWLAGMEWRSFEEVPTKAELLKDAEGMKADWVSVRNGASAIQAGFCAAVEGVAKPVKLNSLAAMLADSREQPWLGIFDLGNGLSWYIAVRDGHAILPDGDVIGNAEAVMAVRESHAGYDDWNYVEGDIELLAELIAEIEAKPTRVKSLVASNLTVVAIAAVTILLAGGAVGGGYWWHHTKQVEEQERLAAMAKMRAQLAGRAVPTEIRSPLLDLAQPNEWLAACNRSIAVLPLSKRGWELGQVECDGSEAAVRWLNKPGATVRGRPDGNVSAQGDTIDQVIPLNGLVKNSSNDAVDLETAKLVLRGWAQSAGFALRMDAPVPPPALPGASAPPKTAMPATAHVVLEISVSPFGLDMSSLPGFRLNRIKTTDAGWHLEGTIYGR